MAKAPKAPDAEASGEDRTVTIQGIIAKVITGCSYDMDNGAIYGRVHQRLREWGATSAEIAGLGDFIKDAVDEHTAEREKQRLARAEKMGITESNALREGLTG